MRNIDIEIQLKFNRIHIVTLFANFCVCVCFYFPLLVCSVVRSFVCLFVIYSMCFDPEFFCRMNTHTHTCKYINCDHIFFTTISIGMIVQFCCTCHVRSEYDDNSQTWLPCQLVWLSDCLSVCYLSRCAPCFLTFPNL